MSDSIFTIIEERERHLADLREVARLYPEATYRSYGDGNIRLTCRDVRDHVTEMEMVQTGSESRFYPYLKVGTIRVYSGHCLGVNAALYSTQTRAPELYKQLVEWVTKESY